MSRRSMLMWFLAATLAWDIVTPPAETPSNATPPAAVVQDAGH